MGLISSVYGNNIYQLKPGKGSGKKKKSKENFLLKKEPLINEFRERLVERSTSAEVAFKHILVDLRIQYKFQKEFKLNRTRFAFADFWLPEYKCVVEIDGGYHNNPIQIYKDKERSKCLIKYNRSKIRTIIRFTNDDVENNPELVKRELQAKLEN